MSEDNEKNKPQIILGGVSGNKELKVRRVHKKKTEQPSETEAPSKGEVKEPVKSAPVKKVEEVKETVKAAAPAPAPVKKAEEAPAKPAAAPAPEKKPVVKEADKAPEKKPQPQTQAAAPKRAEAAEKKAEAPAAKPAAAPEKKEVVIDRRKISSAVVAMPETVRSSTVISDNRGGRYNRDGNRQGGNRNGGYNRDGGNRSGGGNRGPHAGGGFAKDKDDETPNRPPMSRKPSKPKGESPLDEMKKSRANFAEKSAIEKRHNDNDQQRRENGRTQNNSDRRMKNNNSKFNGRINADGEYDDYSYGRKKKKKSTYIAQPVVEQVITDVQIPPFITVKDFAEGIGKKSSDVIKELMKLGVLATINQELDFDTACLLADAFGINATLLEEVTEEDILFDDDADDMPSDNLESRPPVVVVMGHVDHGKTSLLDRIRSASVVAGEAGGITQHIGAYTVRVKGRQITFLDTPGHEAFTTMRARGANFTDIAILVVAADDGVMPQTIESINHAKAANTEIVVAINKIDKPGANPEKVKQELTNYELIPEEWGGSTIMVPVSAKKGEGIDDLLENVLLVADVQELKADPTRQAKGAVIEAKLDKNRGPVATVLVQRGTLKQGDSVVCGAMIGNVRAMYDDKGKDIKKAGPSTPVEILGLPEVPEAGEMLYAVTDDKMARQLVEKRRIKQREDHIRKSSKMSLENLAAAMAEGDVKDLNLIIKADVQGSVEAVTQSVEKLSNEEVHVKVIHGAVGAINESDIMLADVSNAIIIGFNVRPNAAISEKAKEAGVDIRPYSVIYNAIEDIESAMKGMLAPKFEEVVLGHVEIREIFKVSGVGTIGGAYVTDGKITRNCGVRVLRDDIVIYTGKLGSLQRMKDAVKEVNYGYECGLSIENYNDIKIGDTIEAFEEREVARD
ncbi:MAG: translation initiation factor IF-2 [Saccharofermentans sp.]|nr:translation initiation factor IF-2 [Saccharofermentans sp.]